MALTKTTLCNMALSKLGSSRVQLSDFDSDTGEIKSQCALHYEPTLHELVRMHKWNCCKARAKLATGFTVSGLTGSAVDSNGFYIPENVSNIGTVNEKWVHITNTSAEFIIETPAPNTTLWTFIDGTDGAPNLSSAIETDITNLKRPYEYTFNTSATFVKDVPLFQFKHIHTLPTDYIRATYVTNSDEVYEYGKPVVDYNIEDNKILSNFENLWMCYEKEPTPAAMDSLFAQAFATLLAARLAVPLVGERSLSLSLIEEFNKVIMPEARRINAFEKRESPTVDSEWLEATYTSGSSYSNSYPPFSQTSYGSFS